MSQQKDPQKHPQKKNGRHAKKRIVFGVFRTLLLFLLALLLGTKLFAWNAESLAGNRLPMPFGFGLSVVLSGSMEPALSVNDLVILQQTQDVAPGDIIVYESGSDLIIHRVVACDGDTITTKGDANNIVDPSFHRSLVRAKLIASVPALGALVRSLKSPAVTLALLAAALLLLELSFRRQSADDPELRLIQQEIRSLKNQDPLPAPSDLTPPDEPLL